MTAAPEISSCPSWCKDIPHIYTADDEWVFHYGETRTFDVPAVAEVWDGGQVLGVQLIQFDDLKTGESSETRLVVTGEDTIGAPALTRAQIRDLAAWLLNSADHIGEVTR